MARGARILRRARRARGRPIFMRSALKRSAIAIGLALAIHPSFADAAPPTPGPQPAEPSKAAGEADKSAPAADELHAQAAERKQSGDQAMEALRYADALAAY